MIVEDNDDTRVIVRAVLTHHGYEVVEAVTAEEMLERVDEVAPDLVVLDVRLPGMDGCEAMQSLRTIGFDRPIILFSEYYDLFADRIRGCQPDAFLPKSKGPMLLLEGIRQLLPAA
jgi:CheY-like chemotaxis protein